MRLLCVFPLLITLGLLSGCAHTAGRKFETAPVDTFVLDQTMSSQVLGVLGKPKTRRTVTKDGMAFTEFTYVYAEVKPLIVGGDYFIDTLTLEFLDEKLHAYLLFKIAKENDLPLNLEAAKALERGVATKQDVLNLLGKPAGKALSPSNLEVFEDAYGHEIWVWISLRETDAGLETQKVLVGFDFDGTVDSVSSSVTVVDNG